MAKKETTTEEVKSGELVISEKDKAQVTEIVKVIENKEITTDVFGRLSRAQIDLMRRTVAQGASDDELRLFLQVCKGANLNPFLRQAHFVPFWDSKLGEERRTIIIGIDGFRAIAESSGKYAGNDDAVFDGDEILKVEVWEGKGKDRKVNGTKDVTVPKKATVTVYKVVEGQRYPFSASARWNEYYPGGKKGARWHDMPYGQLGKCAEALALRKAFPKLLSGMYAQEEMDQAINAGAEEQKVVQGVSKLKAFLKKATMDDVKEWKKKIKGSDKYNEDQKVEILAAADERMEELKKTK